MNNKKTRKKINLPIKKPTLWGRLKGYFLAGLLVFAPIFITLQVAWWLLEFVDSSIVPYIPYDYNPDKYIREYFGFSFNIPGFGLLILLISITLIGAFATGLAGRWFILIGEKMLDKMPIIRTLYSGSKQIIETVVRNQSDAFRQAVLVEYPRKGLWAIAFVTSNTKGEIKNKLQDDMVNIFLPTTPNPTSGFLLFVPKKDIITLDISVEEAIKLVISAGIVQGVDKNKMPLAPMKKTAKKTKAKTKTSLTKK